MVWFSLPFVALHCSVPISSYHLFAMAGGFLQGYRPMEVTQTDDKSSRVGRETGKLIDVSSGIVIVGLVIIIGSLWVSFEDLRMPGGIDYNPPEEYGALLSEAYAHARRNGDLRSMSTHYFTVDDEGLEFVVSVLDDAVAAEKPVEPSTTASLDPFANLDPSLVVSSVSDTHILAMNKFNTLPEHALVVTVDFAPQTGALNSSDLWAWWQCVRHVRALGFFNGGANAGASQMHRHMQLVPLSVLSSYRPVPPPSVPHSKRVIDEITEAARNNEIRSSSRPWGPGLSFSAEPVRLSSLPFQHALVPLPPRLLSSESICQKEVKAVLVEAYAAVMEAINNPLPWRRPSSTSTSISTSTINSPSSSVLSPLLRIFDERMGEFEPRHAYNLLLHPEWMLAVPRSQREVRGVDINGLGFAGFLLARSEAVSLGLATGDGDMSPLHLLQTVVV